MTRKKQVNAAAVEFLGNQPKGYFNTTSERNTAHTGFIMGVRWADEHPKNPWISVEDRLPDREETFLCALDNGVYVTDCYDYERNRWNSFPDSITHWMPIPTIPKLDKED